MTLVAGIPDHSLPVACALLVVAVFMVLFLLWKSTEVRELPSRARLVVTALRTVDGRPQPVFQISRTIHIDVPPGGLSEGSQINEITEVLSAELPNRLRENQENPPERVEENLESHSPPSETETMTEASTPEETPQSPEDGSEISVRVIFLDDTQKVVKARKSAKIGDFKRLHFREASDRTKIVRLIFNGQVLSNDSRTLEEYGVFDNCAVHCLIHPNRNVQQSQTPEESSSLPSSPLPGDGHAHGDLPRGSRRPGGFERRGAIVAEFEIDLGTLLVPLFAIVLGLCWYYWIIYDELFTTEATVSLVGLTTLFTGFMFVMYLPIRGVE